MFSSPNRPFDLIEVLPPSSAALREYLKQILEDSTKWHAAIESLNAENGTYRIVLEGRLRDAEASRS
ncbi:MAG: hypothetical protein ACREOO_26365 [bacterium]